MSRAERTVTIVNQRGLHARASSRFVTMVAELGIDVEVTREGREVDGSSILDLMMLGAAKGDAITISAKGEGAVEAVERLVALVEARFGED
ncbi:MAG: HPr family phosphocarrier protein [Sphingomonadaceae bacterium]|nr:HPr family phosphocarrier protein [Sphingomonadaceae bacterium]